jgi:hypothetical protein
MIEKERSANRVRSIKERVRVGEGRRREGRAKAEASTFSFAAQITVGSHLASRESTPKKITS